MLTDTQSTLYIGEHSTGKTKTLIDYYLKSINEGIDSQNIIVFVRNKTHETIFREAVLNRIDKPISNIKIFRFRAFVNQVIQDYWFHIFNKVPRFIGFSESIFLIREFIKSYSFKYSEDILNINSLKSGKYNKSIILGIFEKQQRRAENGLSFDEIISLEQDIENNSLSNQINNLLRDYSDWLVNHDTPYLDYALQLDYFYKLIKKEEIINNIAKENNFALLIDDIDDSFYIEHEFYENLWNKIPNIIYTGNKYGSFRQYNGSDIYYLNNLKKKVNKVVEFNENNSSFSNLARKIYTNLTDNNHFLSPYSQDKFSNIEISQSYNYGEMIEEIKKLPLLLKNSGYKADDIIIINQNLDEQIQLEIQRALKNIDFESQVLKGSEELIKKPLINTVITILRIIYYQEIKEFENFPQLSSFDFSQLIHIIGNIDHYYLSKLRKGLKNNPENWLKFFEDYSKKDSYITIKNIYEIIEYCKNLKNRDDSKDKFLEMTIYIWQNLIRKNDNLRKYSNKDDFKIFIDMMSNHLDLSYKHNIDKPFISFLFSLINGEISDNPDKDIIFNNNTVKIMTIQKLCELKQESKVQIWLDITNNSWNHHISTYINPYILLRDRKKNKWTSYEEMKVLEKKLACNLRFSLSLCQDKAYFFSSDYNSMGENNNFELVKNLLQIFKV